MCNVHFTVIKSEKNLSQNSSRKNSECLIAYFGMSPKLCNIVIGTLRRLFSQQFDDIENHRTLFCVYMFAPCIFDWVQSLNVVLIQISPQYYPLRLRGNFYSAAESMHAVSDPEN